MFSKEWGGRQEEREGGKEREGEGRREGGKEREGEGRRGKEREGGKEMESIKEGLQTQPHMCMYMCVHVWYMKLSK